MQQLVAGIDVGGTNTEIGLIDRVGQSLGSSRLGTADFASAGEFVDAAVSATRELLAAAGSEFSLSALGIGAPNGNYHTGQIVDAPNLRWKGVIELAALFRAQLDLPVVLTNDANAAALGERVYGGAKGMNDFLLVTIGTGLGSGFIVNGELVHGHNGFAGELGHTCAVRDGRLCSCGRKGCLEAYVSARGLRQTVAELLAQSSTASALGKLAAEQLDGKAIHAAALSDDPVALEAFEYTGMILGRHLSDAVAYTEPEAIFLFGGITQAGDILLAPTRRHMEANLLSIYRGKVAVLLSELNGKNAAVLGASALGWNELDR